jgi:hypothetical protein
MPDLKDPLVQELERAVKERMSVREARERAEKLKSAVFAALAALLGVVGVGVSLFQLLQDRPLPSTDEIPPPIVLQIRRELENLKSELSESRATVLALQKPSSEIGLSTEQAKITSTIVSFEKRLSAIESAILESPERALSIPLIRKDVGDLSKRSEEFRSTVKAEIDRLYEQQKWMLGGIGTVLLAITGGAITIILRSLPRSKEADDHS